MTIDSKTIASLYVDEADRYVVSFIVSYPHGAAADGGVTSPIEALAAAMALTTDDGAAKTRWMVYDRLTGAMQEIEQGAVYSYLDADWHVS
jgi:hypothetical protein